MRVLTVWLLLYILYPGFYNKTHTQSVYNALRRKLKPGYIVIINLFWSSKSVFVFSFHPLFVVWFFFFGGGGCTTCKMPTQLNVTVNNRVHTPGWMAWPTTPPPPAFVGDFIAEVTFFAFRRMQVQFKQASLLLFLREYGNSRSLPPSDTYSLSQTFIIFFWQIYNAQSECLWNS